MKYNGYDITKMYYSGYTVIAAYSCGNYKVFDDPTRFKIKITKTSNPLKTYSIACNNSSTLTQSEVNECYNKVSGCCVHVDIGDCVTRIGTSASDVTEFAPSTYNGCLVSVTLPDSLRDIGYGSFARCIALESINIPSGVTQIKATAFHYSGLKSIDLHSRITSIGTMAFSDCSVLESITVRATTPPTLGSDAFRNTNNCPIYVPSGSVNSYKNASVWSNYASRIQAIPT